MSVNLTIAGTVYPYPTEGDEGWGTVASQWAAAVSTYLLQRTGGSFSLSAEVDFGATFATKQIYLKSRTTLPATSGFLRLAKTDQLLWRNNLNDGNLPLGIDSSNNLTFNGHILTGSAGVIPVASGGTGISSYTAGDMLYASGTTTLSKLAVGTNHYALLSNGSVPGWGQIVNASVDASAAIAYSKLSLTDSILNADINSAAAIAYSKLNLSGSILNADVNASAAITYSKLALTGSIVNADVNASAAIAYSKLSLSNSILNADVNSSAAIVRSKLASGTANHVVINDSGGAFSSEATLATTRGGLNIASYTTGDIIYASSSSVLAKLGIGTSGQRLSVSGGLPAWGSAATAIAVTTKTGTYTILNTDDLILADASGGSFTLTLPDCATNSGKVFWVYASVAPGANVVTLSKAGSDTIAGMTTVKLGTFGDIIQIASGGGTVWEILNYGISNCLQYESNTARSISDNAATTGQFLMEDKIYDPLGQYNATNAIVTIQVPGTYRFGGSVELASNAGWDRNEYLQLRLYKNTGGGAAQARNVATLYAQATNTLQMATSGFGDIKCAAGDTLEVRVFQNSGGSINTSADPLSNWISLVRVGN